MSDLISRSTLLEQVEVSNFEFDGDYDMDDVIVDIKRAPTAFDLDKVIAELKEMIDPNVDFETGIPCNNWVVDMQNEIIKKCIEIVQKGCVQKN